MKPRLFSVLAAAMLIAACGSQSGTGSSTTSEGGAPATGAGRAGADTGFRSVAYPGSQIDGDRFSTGDPVDRVLAWYWDPDQPAMQRDGKLWTVSKPEKRDAEYLIQLAIVDQGMKSFAVYLSPGANGGTEGRIRPISDEEIKSGVKL